jgi:hypothetical protein
MQIALCQNCKNYLDELTCLAFPNGIPQSILSNERDHRKPLPEQPYWNKFVYEPKVKENAGLQS